MAGAFIGPTTGIFSVYTPKDLSVTNPITAQAVNYSVNHQLAYNHSPNNPLFSNQGKIVSGVDRRGDQWTITVHGPGYVIVTGNDLNNGVLSDNIVTIQLVGTDINSTFVTGNVITSNRLPANSTYGQVDIPQSELVPDGSTIPFQELVDTNGVKSVILNGFDLAQTVTPPAGTPNNVNTGIFLTGGVQYLSFHDIYAPVNTANGDVPVNVYIGDPNVPLKVKPTIAISSVRNTVYDATATSAPLLVPPTTPTVNFVINGQVDNFSLLSASNDVANILVGQNSPAGAAAAAAYLFPTVTTTGRTSIQTLGVNHLGVYGGATNLTVSRASQPFQNSFSGLNHLTKATFNGPTDGVGVDVNGPIGSIAFNQGISNTNNVFSGMTSSGSQVPASGYGVPTSSTSYAGAGYVGGQVTSTRIGALRIRAAGVSTQTPVNPNFIQVNGPGSIYYRVHPGVAATNAAITSAGSINRVHISGDLVNTEIKTGFDYPSYAAGLEGTRAPSRIGRLNQNGNLTNGVISATYRPANHVYGSPGSVAGPGRITGHVTGVANSTGALTALGNAGSGVYARVKVGRLPTSNASQSL